MAVKIIKKEPRSDLITAFASDATPSKELHGGKGAALIEMTQMGLPVPHGFVIHTTAAATHKKSPKFAMRKLMPQVKAEYAKIRSEIGCRPLLSVRSGARVSMPGMMDTVLNIGLTTGAFSLWEDKLGRRAMLDCRRRLQQMYGTVVLGIQSELFELAILSIKGGDCPDSDLTAPMLEDLVKRFDAIYAETGKVLPDTVEGQLKGAIEAVFNSWYGERACDYRAENEIPEDWGTAVNIQSMVFGNAGDDSGSGVLFTRNPATGENAILGEFLPDAQGEDVVAGVRTPMKIEDVCTLPQFDKPMAQLVDIVTQLEIDKGDMQDVEFTIERGELYILQTRTGKRTATAAFRIAREMVGENVISPVQALAKLDPKIYAALGKSVIDPSFATEPYVSGIPACPGIVSGIAVHTSEEAIHAKSVGMDAILIRKETSPDDFKGMVASVGILTELGGTTSHAAVVARSMNKACITGAPRATKIATHTTVTMDGASGRVWVDLEVPVIGGQADENAEACLAMAYEITGAMKEGDELTTERQRVITADWVTHQDKAERSMNRLKTIDDARNVLFDLRGPEHFQREEDRDLINLFVDPAVLNDGSHGKVISMLTCEDGKDATVYLPANMGKFTKLLKARGYRIASDVECVADLLNSDGPVTVDEDVIEEVFGGASYYAELVALLKKAGKEVTAMPVSMSDTEVVAVTFGKEL